MVDLWLELAVTACRQAGLSVHSIETLKTWDGEHAENAVYRLDNGWILKIYGPPVDWRFQTERAVLRILEEHPGVPAPRITAEGELPQGLPYLITTAIPGGETADAWPGLAQPDQLAVAQEVGRIIGALHRLPQDSLASLEGQPDMRNQKAILREEARRTADIIANTEPLSVRQRDALLRFLHEDAPGLLADPPAITHFDLSHHHVYLARDTGKWRVSGIIDWADAVAGPPEWDIVCLWHWTFNGVWQPAFTPGRAMMHCLSAYFSGQKPPERFALRCLAAHLHSPWMSLLWPEFLDRGNRSNDILRDLTAFLFAPEIFGSPV